MNKELAYRARIEWTGNLGQGTASYREYARDHEISTQHGAVIQGSSAPEFRGDPSRANPEELLVAALSACHMLWYLHLCADAGVVVTGYSDQASGRMSLDANGGGRFVEVILSPETLLSESADISLAEHLHERAHELCFIANSVTFDVRCEPSFVVEGEAS